MAIGAMRPRTSWDELALREPVRERESIVAAPVSPSLADEVAYISGVDANGRITATSYWSGFEQVSAFKFGSPTAGTGATISYAFDAGSAFTATEKATFVRALAVWSSIADVRFVESASAPAASILLERGSDGEAYTSGAIVAGSGSVLGHRSGQATISIDTSVAGFDLSGSFDTVGGYGFSTAIHEIGHAIGLGHAGGYDITADPRTDQFSRYDTAAYSIMSYFSWADTYVKFEPAPNEYTVNWGLTSDGYYRTSSQTAMEADIAAIQRLYGASKQTPFSSSQTFGFHSTITGPLSAIYDFANNRTPVLTLSSTASGNTLDLSGFGDNSRVSLVPGSSSDIVGLRGNLRIDAKTWIDNYVGSLGSDDVVGNDHANRIDGGQGSSDWLYGAGGDDVLIGGTSAHLYGGGGDDRLYLVDGSVSDEGGDGFDQAFCSGKSCFVSYGVDVLTFTSAIDVFAQAENTATTIYANAGDDELRGGYEGDKLMGAAGEDELFGEGGDDQLFGGDGDDEIRDDWGNDQLSGGAGADWMAGGRGDDRYLVDSARDVVFERRSEGHDLVTSSIAFVLAAEVEDLQLVGTARSGTGNALANAITGTSGSDTLVGLFGDDVLSGMAGNDRLSGAKGADQLFGGVGLDILDGGEGADRMTGGAGNDHYYVDAAGDVVIEGAASGRDLVTASVATTLAAYVEDLELVGPARRGTGNGLANAITGSDGDDYLAGLDGNDRLSGMVGGDQLSGGAGNDVLVGGTGTDILIGGAGLDRFVFQIGDSAPTAGAADRIADFSHAERDRIDLSGLGAGLRFIATADFSGNAGEVRYAFVGQQTFVTADLDGDRIADFGLRVTGHLTLVTGDFVLGA